MPKIGVMKGKTSILARLLILLSLLSVVEALPRALVKGKQLDHSIFGRLSTFTTKSSLARLQQTRHSSQTTALHAAAKFKNFDQVLETFAEEPVLVAFTTVNCGPCRRMLKELKVVNEEVGNEFKIFAIDTEKWPQLGSRFAIGAVPCVLLFSKGEALLRIEGLTTAQDVLEQIRTTIQL